jgi:NhaP-type Na+/H+ or K+/H+ antiporter
VIFSIAVQGLTLKPLVANLVRAQTAEEEETGPPV